MASIVTLEGNLVRTKEEAVELKGTCTELDDLLTEVINHLDGLNPGNYMKPLIVHSLLLQRKQPMVLTF